jgi:prevent-host-death family protein
MVTSVMDEMHVTVTQLEAELLAVLDAVATSGEPVVVTARGRPIARIVPLDDRASLSGSVAFHTSDDELAQPMNEAWNAEDAPSS